MQRPDARVAAPENVSARGAAGTDQLVVDHVGRHPHEVQVAAVLADDLVPGGVGDEVGEALHGHGVAIVHMACDASASETISAMLPDHQKSIGYCGARPLAISSGSSGDAFSQTSSIERFVL